MFSLCIRARVQALLVNRLIYCSRKMLNLTYRCLWMWLSAVSSTWGYIRMQKCSCIYVCCPLHLKSLLCSSVLHTKVLICHPPPHCRIHMHAPQRLVPCVLTCIYETRLFGETEMKRTVSIGNNLLSGKPSLHVASRESYSSPACFIQIIVNEDQHGKGLL